MNQFKFTPLIIFNLLHLIQFMCFTNNNNKFYLLFLFTHFFINYTYFFFFVHVKIKNFIKHIKGNEIF